MVISITKENFHKEVINSEKPVLLDLYADWCGPCRQLSPLVEEIADSKKDFKVCKVNVREEPEVAAAFNAQNIPTLVVIKNGKITGTSVGSISKQQLLEFMHNSI